MRKIKASNSFSVCKTFIMWNSSNKASQSSYAHPGCRSNISHSALELNTVQTKKSNEMQQDIVILCESPYVYLPIKYYNGNISSWRESFTALNMACCLNAERRMTDSCSRRKFSFCKLKFNNVNIILSLTLRYGMASDDIGYTVD